MSAGNDVLFIFLLILFGLVAVGLVIIYTGGGGGNSSSSSPKATGTGTGTTTTIPSSPPASSTTTPCTLPDCGNTVASSLTWLPGNTIANLAINNATSVTFTYSPNDTLGNSSQTLPYSSSNQYAIQNLSPGTAYTFRSISATNSCGTTLFPFGFNVFNTAPASTTPCSNPTFQTTSASSLVWSPGTKLTNMIQNLAVTNADSVQFNYTPADRLNNTSQTIAYNSSNNYYLYYLASSTTYTFTISAINTCGVTAAPFGSVTYSTYST